MIKDERKKQLFNTWLSKVRSYGAVLSCDIDVIDCYIHLGIKKTVALKDYLQNTKKIKSCLTEK